MSHHIYHTRGFILGSVPVGESNCFYKIFTDELGLLGVVAQAVREGKSKLRYSLQDLSLVDLDLVCGKNVWRVVGAAEVSGVPRAKEAGVVLARSFSLVARLVHGEGKEERLFRVLSSLREFLERETITVEVVRTLEVLVALRVLFVLGYLDGGEFEPFIKDEALSLELLADFENVQRAAIVEVNKALSVSHL